MDNEIQKIVLEFAIAEKPIAMVASASLGAYVAVRVWKLVRKAI